jgi:hypothetical protein
MELKLNIYEHGKIIKTYTSNTCVLPLGVCEDVLNIVDVEALMTNVNEFYKNKSNDNSNISLGFHTFGVVQKLLPKLKPLFLDVFEGLTEEELKKASTTEIVDLVIKIVKYTVTGMFNIKSKN